MPQLNWNFKMWGAVLAVIIVLSASGLVLSQQESEGESVSIISRVNNEGSGIFVRSDITDNFVTIDGTGAVTYNPDDWRGTLFMTPGPSSIQHMMLMQIVKDEMGLSFVQDGQGVSTDGVRWTQKAPGQMLDWMMLPENSGVTGGIAWEPHYAVAVASGECKSILKTSDYWEGHPCCVVAGNNSYLSDNSVAVTRFLAAYVESVQWMQSVMDNGSSDPNWSYLINKAKEVGTPKDPMTDATAEAALNNILYAYELDDLNDQLADVVETYESLGLVNSSNLTNAGFDTPLDFTNHLINGTYLDTVFNDSEHLDLKTPAEMGVVGTGSVRIKVAYLAADVHQLALHVGIEKGYFNDYGIEVELVGPFGAGGDVMNALLSGHANLGFVGSPPVVSLSINALR
ncbi:MAG: ABC transporter substrate-binding protein [Candidatus Thermoplasmatota archaeon]|nr:ABC transporter substrate-binding protein [Candidatus Thermoplasmatota archaeon]